MPSQPPQFPRSHAFIVRIWWEAGLTHPDGRPLWRGQVQHTASGHTVAFQSLDEMQRFIQDQTGPLGREAADGGGSPPTDSPG